MASSNDQAVDKTVEETQNLTLTADKNDQAVDKAVEEKQKLTFTSGSLSSSITTDTSSQKSQGISPLTKFGSSFFGNRNQILVNDENMGSVITSFRKDPTVAFSHCISADVGEERHMSRGVAVVFGKMFGKPSNINMVTSHLTYQQENGGAGVYGLVTKPKYYYKPNKQDYDIAFDHLSKDFRERQFKHLICSPMGCMRDKIKLKHFVHNLVKFQRETGATVNVITFSKYWNKSRIGMSYDEFSRTLNMHISTHENTPQHLPNPEIRSCPMRTVCSTPLTPRTSTQVAPGEISDSEVIKRQLGASVLSEEPSTSGQCAKSPEPSTSGQCAKSPEPSTSGRCAISPDKKDQQIKKNKTDKKPLYDSKGVHIKTGIDMCDCLDLECEGCFFPCPKCQSNKCGHKCRQNREWMYESIIVQGVDGKDRINPLLEFEDEYEDE